MIPLVFGVVLVLCVYLWMCVCFRDAASRRELLSVIGQLADSQPDILVTSLLHCLLNSGVVNKTGEPRCAPELYIQVCF